MSKLTALQEAMRIVEKYAPNLFNVFSQDSRDFLNEVKPCLEQEKEQIIDAYDAGKDDHHHMSFAKEYYNETYGGDK
jgi:hypothetical protein